MSRKCRNWYQNEVDEEIKPFTMVVIELDKMSSAV